MKIIVRKMPNMILDKSFEQINGLYETCYNGNAMDTFMKSIEMSIYEDCLNLEDDIILCKDFLDEVKKVIEKYPNKLISFFTLKDVKETKIMKGRTFCMNQCVYMPKWFNKLLIKFYPYWIKTEKGLKNQTAYDYMMGDLLSMIGEDYVLSVPCLVQHKEMKSRINPKRSSKRQTKQFKGE